MFRYVPSGVYKIGIDAQEAAALIEKGLTFYSNVAVRQTYVRGFWIKTQPVTVREYLEYLEAKGIPDKQYNKSDLGKPVTAVSQTNARKNAAWKTGRLPTAIEWEAAARGKDGRRFPWGNEERSDVIQKESLPKIIDCPEQASPFGVQSLIGYVNEWTSDIVDGLAVVKGSPFNLKLQPHLAKEVRYRSHQQWFNVGFRYVLLERS